MYTYYGPKGPSLVTVPGYRAYTLPLKGQLEFFTDTRFDLSGQTFSHMALLGTSQVSIYQLFDFLSLNFVSGVRLPLLHEKRTIGREVVGST